ncbi:unnamed protein product [Euphydryas editha]|uniref:Uncharacterized protein n=1 Tax=Euphydryas editha TaxID=104508 RepID=A0AAU9TB25_EUPED|nr:unnamed protein product [Euphydryas editha]
MGGTRYCCVVGCKNTQSRNRELSFYSFPTRSWEIKKREEWIKAVRRITIDNKPWQPSKNTRICSAHFVGGKQSNIENSPAYVPTIFPPVYKKKGKSQQTLARHQRLLKRKERMSTSTTPKPQEKKNTASDIETEIDISNVELQIKEEREDPEDNLEIEIEIPSLKLNMVMEHEDEIQEIIKIEENNFQCQICLSVGRRMFPLEEYKEIYKKLLFDNYQDRNDVSLSTLTTVVFSDSNPETIYLIEADKQTDQLNSETDTDNPEANELLIERKIVERKPKFKVIEGVEIFKRLDYDLNDLREVLDERRNEESYKRSRFKCSTCILSFDDENELNEHNRECHDEKNGTHVCDICQCRFSERTQLVSHSRSHFSEFYCRLCSYRCSSEENRDRHGRTHGRPTECLECGQLFGNHCQFNHHYKKSHETFACDHCGLTFKMKLSLVEHISKRHKKSKHKICDKGFHGPTSESAYCEECDLQFTDIYRYKLHLANSVKHKPKQTVRFPCPECLKGFATKSNLKNHYESFHLKLIKFKCVDCDKYFGRNTDLTRHRRKCHDNVRPPKN